MKKSMGGAASLVAVLALVMSANGEARAAGDSSAIGPPPIEAVAARELRRCIESGGAERFTMATPDSVPRPPGVEIPRGATTVFGRLSVDRGDLYIFSGWTGRTNLCGVAAYGVDRSALAERLARTLAATEDWISADPPDGSAATHSRPARYWGDRRNTDLHGAVLLVDDSTPSGPSVQVVYHANSLP